MTAFSRRRTHPQERQGPVYAQLYLSGKAREQRKDGRVFSVYARVRRERTYMMLGRWLFRFPEEQGKKQTFMIDLWF